MTKSLDKLTKLTEEMNAELDEYGLPTDVVKTVDEKLGQATDMIREAQETLATTKAENLVADKATDATIAQLKSDLKDAQTEIKNLKSE